jgi:hypothetical protein
MLTPPRKGYFLATAFFAGALLAAFFAGVFLAAASPGATGPQWVPI